MKLDAQNRTIVVMLFFLTSVSMTGFAQGKVAVGGRFSVWHNGQENSTTIFITPDIGYRLYIPQLQRDEKPYGNTEPVCPIFLLLERTSTFVCGFHCRFRYQ